MSLYLICHLTSAMLLQRVKVKGIQNPDYSRALIKEELSTDPDSELASVQLSLMYSL